MFANELEAWGAASDTHAWFDMLERVQAAERGVDPNSRRLVDAVAAGLYKLMAYKDEYEVARLMLDEDGLDEALHVAGDGGSISYKLHPPMLRALGLENKIDIPMSAKPAIELLAKGKRVRGTMLDPFRWAKVRRVERQLVGEYRKAIDRTLASLDTASLDRGVEIAELPDIVRGYEDIKLANVARFRSELKRLTP